MFNPKMLGGGGAFGGECIKCLFLLQNEHPSEGEWWG